MCHFHLGGKKELMSSNAGFGFYLKYLQKIQSKRQLLFVGRLSLQTSGVTRGVVHLFFDFIQKVSLQMQNLQYKERRFVAYAVLNEKLKYWQATNLKLYTWCELLKWKRLSYGALCFRFPKIITFAASVLNICYRKVLSHPLNFGPEKLKGLYRLISYSCQLKPESRKT